MGIKQVKDGCWAFGDGDKFCYPLKKSATLPLKYSDMPEGYPKVERKMVEIVSEQSVTGQYMPAGDGYPAGYVDDIPTDTDLFKIGVKYKVKINNTSYDAEAMSLEDNMVMLMIDEAQSISHYGGGMVLSWGENFGETITLAIYEEQEVVKPLDVKYLPIEELKIALGLDVPV